MTNYRYRFAECVLLKLSRSLLKVLLPFKILVSFKSNGSKTIGKKFEIIVFWKKDLTFACFKVPRNLFKDVKRLRIREPA